MKANLLFGLLLCAIVTSPVFSQTTIGNQKVDQYPVSAAGALTYGLTYIPADYDPAKKYPLIIFLHGSGEGGDGVSGLNNLVNQGLPWWIARGFKPSAVSPVDGLTYEFIVCSPQAPAFWQWSYDFNEIQYMVPDILNRYSIDQSRMYVTGLSAGGSGTWSCMTHDPAFAMKFAAIMPNSDAGFNNTPLEAPFLHDITSVYGVPVWCVDGALDGLHGHTTLYLDTINAGPPPANPQAVQTLIAGAGHSAAAWDSAYSPTWRSNVFNQTAYEWFLRYKRSPAVLTAYAGVNQTITLPSNSATLSGSGSPSAGNSITSYGWTEISGPSSPTITAASSATASVNPLIAGTYTFQLTVKDNTGASATSTMTVTVNPAPNVPPTVSAGTTQTITLPLNSVTLTGTASGNGGATISSTNWSETTGPNTVVPATPAALSTTVGGLIAGTYTFQLSATDNHGLSTPASVTIIVKAANVPPAVSAGTTQTITLPVNSVTLTGTASGNGGATISSTTWSETTGPNTVVPATPSTLSTAVGGLIAGTYTFQLSATDNNGLSTPASVTVIVKPANVPPTASAGTTQTITLPLNSVTLTGTASGNGGATISTTTWTEAAGPNTVVPATPGSLSTTVGGLIAGTYTFQLSATDNNGLSTPASVTVIVKPANVAPSVNAGSSQNITLPTNSVTLTGTASGNGGATISSTTWTETAGPNTVVPATPSSLSTTVGGMIAGTYTFQLSATDNNGLSNSATVTVIVNPAASVPPTANAGTNQTITLPLNSVTLTGTASGNGGATISTTTWTQTSGPNTVVPATPSSLSTTVGGLIAGPYSFELSVIDNNGLTATSTVTVTVKAANVPPTVSAGTTQTITLPLNSVTLTGTASGNSGATISSTTWTETAGPNMVVPATPSSLSTTVGGLIAGTYTFQLSATDNNGLSATSTVTVTVNAAVPPPPPPPPPPNQPPTVSAGSDQNITLPSNSVTLTGTASGNGGATISNTTWTETAGPNTIVPATPSSLSTAVSGLIAGTYTFQLSATDNNSLSATSTVTVTVNAAVPPPPPPPPPPPANQLPVANAGPDQSIQLPASSANLDGMASYDPDGTIASYSWMQLSGPAGTTITNSNTATPAVSGLQAATYVFQLTVTDNQGATDTAQVTITVSAATPITPPVADAGKDTTIAIPASTVLLNGSGSIDPGGNIVSYQWEQISGPAGATILSTQSAVSTVNNLQLGSYVFCLRVANAQGDTAISMVKVNVVSNARTTGNHLFLYPNPAQSIVHLRITGDGTGVAIVNIYDVNGRLVMRTSEVLQAGFSDTEINVSSLLKGMYTIYVMTPDKKTLRIKLMKQ
jgi:Secretion system C-terminal sorting domain/PKD domain